MDAEKSKKLQQYAVALTEQAKEEERTGKSDEAIKHYLKLVDVFLVLAAEAPDHNTWSQYVRQAEAYQSRTRALIPKDQQDQNSRRPVANNQPSETPSSPRKNESDQNRFSPLKRIIKPFQRSEGETSSAERIPTTSRPSMQSELPRQQPARVSTTVATEMVSPEAYQRVMSENKILRDKISSLAKEKEEQLASLEKDYRELEEKVSGMVPRADYDALQSEFNNSIPKFEYDRVKAELLSSVPKAHYDELLNKIVDMVPKQVYFDEVKRSLELEETVKNSVPKKVIDDLAIEISLLGTLSQVPLEDVAGAKEEETMEEVAGAREEEAIES